MHRLTARLLLFFALVGSLVPVAVATTATARACCLRKGVHHCQDSIASDSDELVIRDASCCNGGCGRALTSHRWAQAQPLALHSFARSVKPYLGQASPVSASLELYGSRSTRAPPAC